MMDTQKAWLSYLAGWITGLVFFLIERDDKYVKFHAMQSILWSAAVYIGLFVCFIIGLIIPVFGAVLYYIVVAAALVSWIISMLKASKGEWFKWPVIGDMALKISSK